MKKLVVAICFALFSITSLAESGQTSLNVSNLTREQQQALQTIANQMAEKKTDTPAILAAVKNIDKEAVRGWAEAGTEAGKAVGNFAREIGIATERFLGTFVGQATFVLVFMNYGGGKLAQFMFHMIALIALTPVFCWFITKVFKRFVLQVVTVTEKKYNPNPFWRLLGFNEVVTKTEKVQFDGDENIPSGWQATLGWIFIVACSCLFFGLLWPRWA